MYSNKYTIDIYSVIMKSIGMILILAALLTFLGSGAMALGATSGWRRDNDHSKYDIGDVVRNNILSFKNERVSAGESLVVEGAPKGSVYQWSIKGADGVEKAFLTNDNSHTPEDSDLEKLITVTVEDLEGAKAVIYNSSLPVAYVNNSSGYYGVGEEYSDAVMSMQGNKLFDKKKDLYSGEIQIRLRGNSTMWREKAPFHIKLDTKADLLGLGENKHFALLANDIDHTLMRNKLMYDFSDAIGMDTYMKSENVVLIFNNQYYGVYQLCELVNLGSNRVDIYDWEESAKAVAKAILKQLTDNGELAEEVIDEVKGNLENALCTNLSWSASPYRFTYDVNQDGTTETYTISDYIKLPAATGGILMEMDFYAFDGNNPSTAITSYSQPWYFKSPEYAITNDTLYEYTKKQIQTFEYALHSTDFTYHENEEKYISLNRAGGYKNSGYAGSDFTAPEYEGKHYSDMFDFDSLVQNFIVCEFSMNWDGMKNSVFMYKDIDGLFHLGPVWDFDWALGNINMFGTNTWYPTSWHTTEKNFAIEQYYQKVQWNRCLIKDPYFLVKAYEKYHEIRSTAIEDMIKNGGTIDEYAKEIQFAAIANDAKWEDTYKQYQSVGFQQSLINMKEFINLRIAWMDQQFASLNAFISSLSYYKPSKELSVIDVDTKSEKGYVIVTADILDVDIATVAFQVNGTHIYDSKVTEGKAICNISDKDLLEDKDKLNVIQILAKDVSGKYIISSMEEGNYYNAKSNYAVFYYNRENDENTNRVGTLPVKTQSDEHVISSIIIIIGLTLIGIGIIVLVVAYRRKKRR